MPSKHLVRTITVSVVLEDTEFADVNTNLSVLEAKELLDRVLGSGTDELGGYRTLEEHIEYVD